jgi:hypothetical protein
MIGLAVRQDNLGQRCGFVADEIEYLCQTACIEDIPGNTGRVAENKTTPTAKQLSVQRGKSGSAA